MLAALLLAQVSGASSLRDLVALLESQDARRYYSGLPKIARSTLADAMAGRPAAVFTDVLSKLIGTFMASIPGEVGHCVRLIHSTTSTLSRLSADWTHFSSTLCGAKAHVVYDPDADCPVYFGFTPAQLTDLAAAKAMPVEPGCTYVFDLGYYDFSWWKALDQAGCRLVTRQKKNTPFHNAQA